MHTACVIVGGMRELAEHLGVPVAMVGDWLDGEIEPPQAMFIAAVEIILLHLEAQRPSA